jgi:hypothetical protein
MDNLSMINVDVDWREEQMFVRCMRTDCEWEDEIAPTASSSIPALIERAQRHVREAHATEVRVCGDWQPNSDLAPVRCTLAADHEGLHRAYLSPARAPRCSHGYQLGARGQHLATNGACSDQNYQGMPRAWSFIVADDDAWKSGDASAR